MKDGFALLLWELWRDARTVLEALQGGRLSCDPSWARQTLAEAARAIQAALAAIPEGPEAHQESARPVAGGVGADIASASPATAHRCAAPTRHR